MRVQFEYTQEDMVDTSKRLLARSKVVRSWRWHELIATSILAWILVFAVCYRAPVKGALLASLTALISALLSPGMQKRTTERRLRKFYKEHFSEANSFVCDVELTPAEVRIRQPNIQISFEWKSVEDISVTEDAVEIFARTGGVVVRNRAFKSADERQQFVDLARSYLESARRTGDAAK